MSIIKWLNLDNLFHDIIQMLDDIGALLISLLQVCFKQNEWVHIIEAMVYREHGGWIATSSKCELTTNNSSSYWYNVKSTHEVWQSSTLKIIITLSMLETHRVGF